MNWNCRCKHGLSVPNLLLVIYAGLNLLLLGLQGGFTVGKNAPERQPPAMPRRLETNRIMFAQDPSGQSRTPPAAGSLNVARDNYVRSSCRDETALERL
jgi:hypothetical protein